MQTTKRDDQRERLEISEMEGRMRVEETFLGEDRCPFWHGFCQSKPVPFVRRGVSPHERKTYESRGAECRVGLECPEDPSSLYATIGMKKTVPFVTPGKVVSLDKAPRHGDDAVLPWVVL